MTKIHSRTTPWLALVLLSLSPALRADDAKPPSPKPSKHGVMVSAGLGPADSGLLGVASIQARRGSRLLGVRIASASPVDLFGDSPSPSDTSYDLLFGRYTPRRRGYTSVSTGLSVVSSLRRGRFVSRDCVFLFGCSSHFERVVTRNVGLPFEAKAVLSTRFAGIGLSVIGNLNPKGSFIGAGVTLELGVLR